MANRLTPYSPAWQAVANEMARSFCPTIYACAECSHPVIEGYICGACGNTSPKTTKAQRVALKADMDAKWSK